MQNENQCVRYSISLKLVSVGVAVYQKLILQFDMRKPLSKIFLSPIVCSFCIVLGELNSEPLKNSTLQKCNILKRHLHFFRKAFKMKLSLRNHIFK